MKSLKSLLALFLIVSAILAGLSQTTQAQLLKTMEEVRSAAVSGAPTVTSTPAVSPRTCEVSPAGGYFASSTPAQIKCGADVVSALYVWTGERITKIYNRSAVAVYQPTADKSLYVSWRYLYRDSKGAVKIMNSFKKFEFKKAAIVSPSSITCDITPAGGTFATSTPVAIKCGSNVVNAIYKWSDSAPARINGRNAKTYYEPMKDKYLEITGVYMYKDGKTKISSFLKKYEFKKAPQPVPTPYYYPYPYPEVKAQGISVQGHKITLPTLTQVIAKLK